MTNKWVKVFSSQDFVECTLLKSFLENLPMEVVLLNKRDSFLLIGDCELLVKNTDVVKALHAIENYYHA